MFGKESGLSTSQLLLIQAQIQQGLNGLKTDNQDKQSLLAGALAVDARLFKDIVENQIILQEKVKKLENLFINLQSETSLLKSVSKSRNVSDVEEKSAELRSKAVGRKSHQEMCKELNIDGGNNL